MAQWQRRRSQWLPTPVLLPGKSHGQRSLVGYSPWGHEASETTERLHFHFHREFSGCSVKSSRGGREAEEEGDMCILWLTHVVIWQKSTHHCKAIIFQITKQKICITTQQSHSCYLLKRNENKRTCKRVFPAALFIIVPNRK